ncbi:MAG: RNA polymerase sigma factor [Acidimicrobiales bacterium]
MRSSTACWRRHRPETKELSRPSTGPSIPEALTPAQAEVVLLRVLADLDVGQVAAIVGRRPGAVRVLQHKALQRLAKSIPSLEGVTT